MKEDTKDPSKEELSALAPSESISVLTGETPTVEQALERLHSIPPWEQPSDIALQDLIDAQNKEVVRPKKKRRSKR